MDRANDVVFFSRGLVRSGDVRNIEHVVYVDPRAYDLLDPARRAAVSRGVARVNDAGGDVLAGVTG